MDDMILDDLLDGIMHFHDCLTPQALLWRAKNASSARATYHPVVKDETPNPGALNGEALNTACAQSVASLPVRERW
jgi:hypothetical protein